MNTEKPKGAEGAKEAPKNPEIRDQVKELFLAAGFKEDVGASKSWGNSLLWLTHPSGRHVYIQPDKASESGWSITIRGGLDKIQRGRIARLLGKLKGEEDDNRKEILEGSGKFKFGALLPQPENELISNKGNETYAIEVVG